MRIIIESWNKEMGYLLRGILKAHSKGPIESLYLETGKIPLRYAVFHTCKSILS